jgi:pilus assembly protein CpaB
MPRQIFSVVFGLALAAGALYLVYNLRGITPAAEAAPAVLPTVTILVAADQIAFGDPIGPDLIKATLWPADSAPQGAILDRDELLAGPEGARIAIKSFVAGEPFLKTKVSGYGEKPTLSRKVEDGKRAFSIRIDDVSGVAGFLLPGDRVDVQLTRRLNGSRDNLITDVIIQSVTVLGIDQLASEETDDPVVARTATVEVTPEQAQKLALSQQLGTLSLTLRHHTNIDEAEVKRITVNDLANETARPVQRDNGVYVKVRKGTDVRSERVPM